MRIPTLSPSTLSFPKSPRWPRPKLVDPSHDVAAAVAELLAELDVVGCYGLTGGALARLVDALGKAPFPVVHFRHEAGAAFAALEASLVSGRPAAVFATTGPGITNTITGLLAARGEGAKVILISASTGAALRGRGACQETTSATLPAGLLEEGPLFHYAQVIDHPAQLEVAAARLRSGLARPGAFLAHLCLPSHVHAMPAPELGPALIALPGYSPSQDAIRLCADRLNAAPFVIWAGFGARDAAAQVRALAERTGAPVMCSPRAKGIFPERHPLYLGVTGLGGHDPVEAYFAEHRPAHVLVLGTRMGEPTSYWSPALAPSEAFLQVDVDPTAFGVAYPAVSTFGVVAEIGAFLSALTPRLRTSPQLARPPLGPTWNVDPGPAIAGAPVRAAALMNAIQRRVVDGSDAVLLSEAGNAFAWTNHLLAFQQPGRYRVSVGFGSMAHATAGVVGAALARHGKAVAVVGDGSMLMLTEVSTAVRTHAQAVWIVLNDSRYAMVEEGMKALGLSPVDTAIPTVDFAQVARGYGAQALKVDTEAELDAGLEQAMAASGPFVLDVRMNATEAGPWVKRIQALIAQGQAARRQP